MGVADTALLQCNSGSSVSIVSLSTAELNHPYCKFSMSNVQMNNESSSALPPLQRSGVWNFKLLRIVLLGTADKDSILERLPKGDGVLDIVLGPLVVYYELQAKDVDLAKGAQGGTLTQSQMELVTCFAPDRVHETSGWVSVAQQHLPVCIESSVDALHSVLHGTVS